MNFLAIVLTVFATLLTSSHSMAGGNFKPLYPALVPDSSLATLPEQTKLMSPDFFAKISGTQVTLKWTPVVGVTGYYLQVSTDANFWNLIIDKSDLAETSFEVSGLEKGKHYFWRVYTMKSDNEVGYLKGLAVKSMFEVQ